VGFTFVVLLRLPLALNAGGLLFVLGTILTATTFNFNQMIISCIITGVSAARKMHHAMCYLSEICLSRTPQARFPSLSLSSLVCRSPADATLTC
jgi:hypothetical protein